MPKVLSNRAPHIKCMEAVQKLVGNGTNDDIAKALDVKTSQYVNWKTTNADIPARHIARLVCLSGDRFEIEDFFPKDETRTT